MPSDKPFNCNFLNITEATNRKDIYKKQLATRLVGLKTPLSWKS